MSDWSDSYKTAEGDMFSPYERQYAKDNKSKSIAQVKKASHSKTNFRKRGMGDTGFTKQPLTDIERQSILLLKTKGLTDSDIALKLKRSTQVIAKVLKDAEVATLDIGLDWRDVMEKKAIVAVNAGLDCVDDPYKRGTLGIAAGKGLGIFEQEGAVNFQQLIAQIPESQKSRYITLENPNAIHVEERKNDQFRDTAGGVGEKAGS